MCGVCVRSVSAWGTCSMGLGWENEWHLSQSEIYSIWGKIWLLVRYWWGKIWVRVRYIGYCMRSESYWDTVYMAWDLTHSEIHSIVYGVRNHYIVSNLIKSTVICSMTCTACRYETWFIVGETLYTLRFVSYSTVRYTAWDLCPCHDIWVVERGLWGEGMISDSLTDSKSCLLHCQMPLSTVSKSEILQNSTKCWVSLQFYNVLSVS